MATCEPIHVVCCVDDNFCLPLGVLIQSVLENTERPVQFHLLHANLSRENLSCLQQVENLLLYDVSTPELVGRINPNIDPSFASRMSVATYFRFLIPWVLPADLQRVLFLDADMLAVGDLNPLYSMALDGNTVVVAEDAKLSGGAHPGSLGILASQYFNAGMMLIDLVQWRATKVSERCLELLSSGTDWPYNDQDILNLLLQTHCLFVTNAYNTQSHGLNDRLLESAVVIHFTGAEKPWHVSSVHPATESFRAVKARSVYADIPLSEHLDKDDRRVVSKLQRIECATSILIYGCGQRGRRLFHFIKQNLPKVQVAGFVDKSFGASYQDLPVYSHVPEDTEHAILIGSFAFRDEIHSALRKSGIEQHRII